MPQPPEMESGYRFCLPASRVKGCLAGLMLVLNTLVRRAPLFFVAVLKLLVPVEAWRRAIISPEPISPYYQPR